MRSLLVILFLLTAQYAFSQLSPGKIKTNVQSLKAKIDQKVNLDTVKVPLDTIKVINLSDTLKLKSPIDSLQQSQKLGVEKLHEKSIEAGNVVQSKADSSLLYVNDKTQKIQSEIEERSKELKLPKEAKELTGDLPTQQKTEIPDLKISLPEGNTIPSKDTPQFPKASQNLPPVNQSLPNIIPDIQEVKSKIPSSDIKLPDSLSIAAIKDSLSVEDLNKIPGIDSKKVKELTGVVDEVSPYQKRIDSLSWNDLKEIGMTEIESASRQLSEVNMVDAEMQKVYALKAQQESLVQRYRDQKMLADEISRKSRNVANDQLNKFSPAFKNIQEKIGKTKKTYSSVHSLKDIPKKPPNELKGKPFYERIIPGISVQPYISDSYSLEIGPQVGYRFTTRLSGGIGGIYRISFSRNYKYYANNEGVYGFRTYADFNAFKSFYLHGEVGNLKFSNTAYSSQEQTSENIWFGHIGASKQFDISRKIRGEIIALYRVEFDGFLPGVNRFSVRMVINYKTKKIRKPTDIE